MATQEDKRVVAIAVDGSENAYYAFKFYLENVMKPSDKIFLVHSVEVNNVLHSTQWYSSPYSFDKDVLMKLLEDEKVKIKVKLEEFAKWLKEAKIDGTVKSIHCDSPGEGLCKAAEEINASLIVVGTRGLGKIRRTFMGSVSDYILHHAKVPVLVCRHKDHHEQKHEETEQQKKH